MASTDVQVIIKVIKISTTIDNTQFKEFLKINIPNNN